MSDWFFEQYETPPPEPSSPPIKHVSRQRVVTLSIRNRTYLPWTVSIHGSKTCDARVKSLGLRPLVVQPNDRSSCTLVRLISNESVRIDRIEVQASISSSATITLLDDERREHAWHHLPANTDVSLCVDWGPSDSMSGHVAPLLAVETIHLEGGES
jgi:hypothetical protein